MFWQGLRGCPRCTHILDPPAVLAAVQDMPSARVEDRSYTLSRLKEKNVDRVMVDKVSSGRPTGMSEATQVILDPFLNDVALERLVFIDVGVMQLLWGKPCLLVIDPNASS